MKYTANYFCRAAEIVCSVLHKWHLRFYLIPHSDFGFFSCVGYLHPKDYIKSVKNPFLNFKVNNLYHPLVFLMLKSYLMVLEFSSNNSEGIVYEMVIDMNFGQPVRSARRHPLLVQVVVDHDGSPRRGDALLRSFVTAK